MSEHGLVQHLDPTIAARQGNAGNVLAGAHVGMGELVGESPHLFAQLAVLFAERAKLADPTPLY